MKGLAIRSQNGVLVFSLVLNTLLTIVEIVAGVVVGSLALVADGSRNLTDSLMLIVALFADQVSTREPDELRTWGYGRVKIVAALLNTGIILAVALWIGYEALMRFGEHVAVHGSAVILVAILSILVNGAAALLLKNKRSDITIRTVYTGLFYGAVSSSGVLVAGVLLASFHWEWVDSVTGMAIAAMLLFATVKLAWEAIHILLEGVPANVDMLEVRRRLLAIDTVDDIREMHAWTLSHDSLAFSCHLVVEAPKLAKSRKVVDEAKRVLRQDFGFTHMTIEVDIIKA
jgi:cobalt-zinc-cadmium efflux system protein